MKYMHSWVRFGLSIVVLAAAPIQLRAQATSTDADFGFRLITPALTTQGESFTGRVVASTPQGEEPLQAGSRVSTQGRVVVVEDGGRIDFNPFDQQLGNTFLRVAILEELAGGGSVPVQRTSTLEAPVTLSQHVEVLRIGSQVPIWIAEAAGIITPENFFRVRGQGLDGLREAVLLGADANEIQLGEGVGSSLERIYRAPPSLTQGDFRFVGVDESGHRYQAPEKSRNPTLRLEGPPVRRRGQRGKISLSCDVDGIILLTGGRPHISLDRHRIEMEAGRPNTVGFTALQIGDYKVSCLATQLVWTRKGVFCVRVDSTGFIPYVAAFS